MAPGAVVPAVSHLPARRQRKPDRLCRRPL